MRLADQFRECVAFLRIEDEDAATGTRELQVRATAFIIQVPVTANAVRPYVVTAAHVVQKARSQSVPLVLRLNTDDGWEDIEIPADAWSEHPTSDVAVSEAEISQDAWHNLTSVPLEALADDECVAKYDIGEGDEVFMPGLFTSMPGEARDEPVVRFGHIALGLQESLTLRMPSGKTNMAAYLIETRSWGGESGSPVFVSFMGAQGFAPPREGMSKLLGLIHGHYEIDAKVKFSGPEDKAITPLNAGIAAMIPAQKIIDVLMQEDFVAKRQAEARKIEDERPTPVLDVASPESKPDEFKRFEDLTRKLVQTPKPKSDES